MGALQRLRYLPVLCAINGKLAAGAACGEIMPPRAKARSTREHAASEIEIERSKTPFKTEVDDGPVAYPVPYEPECCNYKACGGKTLPYGLVERDPRAFTVALRPTLAVWPKDAEIDLVAREPGVEDEALLRGAPWTARETGASATTDQAFELGARRYAAVAGSVFFDLGAGWQKASGLAPGPRRYHLLATFDLDGDRRPELLVFAQWANDYGLFVFANDGIKPLYGFSCGNI